MKRWGTDHDYELAELDLPFSRGCDWRHQVEGLIGLVDGEREIRVLPSSNWKPYAA